MYLNAEVAEVGKIYMVEGLNCKIKIISKSIFPGGECLSVLIEDEREPGFPYRIAASTRLAALSEEEQKFTRGVLKPIPSAAPPRSKIISTTSGVSDKKSITASSAVSPASSTVVKSVSAASISKPITARLSSVGSEKLPSRSSVIDKLLSVIPDGVIPDWKIIEDAVIAQCCVADADRGKIRNQSKIRWKWYTAEGKINPFLKI